MRQARRSWALLTVIVPAAVALAAAGCGGGSSSGNGGGSSGGGAYGGGGSASGGGGSGGGGGSSASSQAAIGAKSNSDLGTTVLVDSKGDTVYLFEKDESDESYCSGACASVWPPVTTKGAAQVSGAVDASKLGTIKRDDGSTQVTYAGHPLYTYVKDTKPGDANGNGIDEFGAEWYALEPSGAMAEEKGGEKSGSGGGGGYKSGGSSY